MLHTKFYPLIGQVKGDNSRLLARNLCMKARAYYNLGCIAAEGASTESVKEAVVRVEKELELREAIGNAVGVDNAKFSIAVAKSIGNEKELLKSSQGVHVLYANVYDKEHTLMINTDRTLLLGAMDCPPQNQQIF